MCAELGTKSAKVCLYDKLFKIRQATDPESIRAMEKINIYFGEHAIEIDCEVEEIDCEVEAVELATKLAMHVVDLSSGQLLDLCIHRFGSSHLLEYISYRHVYLFIYECINH